jgi:glycosyltransferase involved in cell wall biosynthesis
MAAGKPVVAVIPQESEIAKMIAEEKCGIVLKPGNGEALKKAILELYCDKDKGRVMGENGRIAIDVKYNLSSAAKQYYDLIVKYLIK